MLKKKNYKEQQHFNTLHTFSAYAPATPTSPPKKYQVYYKRYRKRQQSQNLYNLIHSQPDNKDNQDGQAVVGPKYSEDRTLELISFDGDLGFLKKYLRKIGKIRQYDTGEGVYKGQRINTAMCVYKFQFDLIKCFRDQYLQTIISQQCLESSKTLTPQARSQQQYNLISQHMGKQLNEKVSKLKQMKAGGYNVITDIYGQYRFDYQANQKFVEKLPQVLKKNKMVAKQKQKEMEKQMQKMEKGMEMGSRR